MLLVFFSDLLTYIFFQASEIILSRCDKIMMYNGSRVEVVPLDDRIRSEVAAAINEFATDGTDSSSPSATSLSSQFLSHISLYLAYVMNSSSDYLYGLQRHT